MLKKFSFALLALCCSVTSYAADIKVEDAWVYASEQGRTTANVYFYITSSDAAQISAASSPAAKKVIFETMDHSNGKMTILTVDQIELPADKKLDLTSEHRHHLKLIDLKKPLKAGQQIDVSIEVNTGAKKQTVPIKVQVKEQASQSQNHTHSHHHQN